MEPGFYYVTPAFFAFFASVIVIYISFHDPIYHNLKKPRWTPDSSILVSSSFYLALIAIMTVYWEKKILMTYEQLVVLKVVFCLEVGLNFIWLLLFLRFKKFRAAYVVNSFVFAFLLSSACIYFFYLLPLAMIYFLASSWSLFTLCLSYRFSRLPQILE